MIGGIKRRLAEEGGSWTALARRILRRLTGSDFARKVAETYGTRIIGILLGLVTSVIVTRILGPEGRGRFAVAMALTGIGIQFGNLGLQSSNTYYVAKDRRLLPGVLGNSLVVAFGMGGLGALITWFLFALFPSWAPTQGLLLVLALVAIPLGLGNLLLQNLLLGLQKIRAYNTIELTLKIVSVALIALLILAKSVNAETLFGVSLACFVLALAWLGWILRGNLAGKRPVFSVALLKEHMGYGMKAYLGAFFGFLVLRSDLLLVQHLKGDEASGYYSIASNMADYLYQLPTVMGLVIFPKLASMTDLREKWHMARRAALGLALLMVPICALAALLAGPAIHLMFGAKFLPAVPSFMILCIGMFFYGVNNMFANFLSASDYPWFAVHVWWIGLLLNIGLNLAWIPRYGIEGAAWSSVVCYGLVLALDLWYARRLVGRAA